MGIIKVVNAHKTFKSKLESKVVLSDFHMNVKRGSIYALMGASGCGKTTLVSCIVGMEQLDKGHIKVFNDIVKKNNSKIGYMPQEIALIGKFTISEMIHFFGVIFGMKEERIEERLRFLSKLLELPPDDKIIEECSGGQQRRISFAIALVHEPEILILDEPTSGVDPILRSKIWNHLVHLSKIQNVTILLTTHYIEEARQSTHVGLMRKGVLIAEDTPQNLLEMCETESLEETFLKLSEGQENGYRGQKYFLREESDQTIMKQSSKRYKKTVELFTPSNGRKLRALIMKNTIQVVRNPGFLMFALVLPFIGIICLHNTIGGNPKGLVLGIVDGEVSSLSECANRSLKTFELDGFECRLKKISCRFIHEINDSIAIKKYYTRYEEAERDTKLGKTVGFVYLSRNFSSSFGVLKDWNKLSYSGDGIIQVRLDHTDLQIVTFLQRNLLGAYHRFVEKLMMDCKKSTRAGSIPIEFETFHGSLDDEIKQTMVSGLIMATFFMLTSYLTSMALIDDRRCGIWNRSLMAGATPFQFFIAHLITGTALMSLQALEFIVYAVYISNNSLRATFIIPVAALIFLLGEAGCLYGLCISVLTDSTLAANYFSILATYPFLALSGIFWPLQGVPWLLKYIGYLLPFTLPSRALLSVMFGDRDLTDNPSIPIGFSVLLIWIIVEFIVCFKFSK